MQRLEGFYHKEYNIMGWVDQCKEIWGELHWKSTLAHMIGVNKSTVRRWGTGQCPMRQVVVDKVDATYKIWKDNKQKP